MSLKDAIKEASNIQYSYSNNKLNLRTAKERITDIMSTFNDKERLIIRSEITSTELINNKET